MIQLMWLIVLCIALLLACQESNSSKGSNLLNAEIDRQALLQVGQFSTFWHDKMEIIPVEFYPGKKYEDVCISAVQLSLGYGSRKQLDKLSKYWDY